MSWTSAECGSPGFQARAGRRRWSPPRASTTTASSRRWIAVLPVRLCIFGDRHLPQPGPPPRARLPRRSVWSRPSAWECIHQEIGRSGRGCYCAGRSGSVAGWAGCPGRECGSGRSGCGGTEARGQSGAVAGNAGLRRGNGLPARNPAPASGGRRGVTQAASACSRSAMMSSVASIPTESRTRLS